MLRESPPLQVKLHPKGLSADQRRIETLWSAIMTGLPRGHVISAVDEYRDVPANETWGARGVLRVRWENGSFGL